MFKSPIILHTNTRARARIIFASVYALVAGETRKLDSFSSDVKVTDLQVTHHPAHAHAHTTHPRVHACSFFQEFVTELVETAKVDWLKDFKTTNDKKALIAKVRLVWGFVFSIGCVQVQLFLQQGFTRLLITLRLSGFFLCEYVSFFSRRLLIANGWFCVSCLLCRLVMYTIAFFTA